MQLPSQDTCQHDWCYASYVLASNPPLYPRVCRRCGKEEMERGTYYDVGEYDEIMKKFKC